MSASRFSWGVRTDVGHVRSINQDSVHAEDGLFVVADGMGGHRGGEVASAAAVETFTDGSDLETIDDLIDLVRNAHRAILEQADGDPDLRGMGTTLCAIAQLDATTLGLVNVGDSRIYRFDDGELRQISEDHSLVGDLYRSGHLTAEEAATHPQRNVVTRALGIGDDLLVDYWELPAVVGDRYLLCSDGLVDEVNDNQIAAVLRRLDSPAEGVDDLVRLANESGGRDNVSVLIVRVESGAEGDDAQLVFAPQISVPVRSAPSPVVSSRGTDRLVDGRSQPEPQPDTEDDRPKMRMQGRVLASVVFAALILVAGFWLIASYARNNYYVGFEQEQVVIFQGRPGGVLWFDPTVEEGAALVREGLTPALALEVDGNPEFGSLADAQEYVVDLEERSTPSEAPIDPSTGDG